MDPLRGAATARRDARAANSCLRLIKREFPGDLRKSPVSWTGFPVIGAIVLWGGGAFLSSIVGTNNGRSWLSWQLLPVLVIQPIDDVCCQKLLDPGRQASFTVPVFQTCCLCEDRTCSGYFCTRLAFLINLSSRWRGRASIQTLAASPPGRHPPTERRVSLNGLSLEKRLFCPPSADDRPTRTQEEVQRSWLIAAAPC